MCGGGGGKGGGVKGHIARSGRGTGRYSQANFKKY